MVLVRIFFTFIIIGLMSFGGGYSMLSFIQNLVVTEYGWITIGEYTDMIAISQATPGPIAVNIATYTGYKVGGLGGAALANIGLLIPALVIVITICIIMSKKGDNIYIQSALNGLKPAAAALIIASAITIGAENIVSLYNALICCVSLFLVSYLKVNPIYVLLFFGIVGIFVF